MTVNTHDVQVGDTITLRNGSEHVVIDVYVYREDSTQRVIRWGPAGSQWYVFTQRGHAGADEYDSDVDIVAHKPKEQRVVDVSTLRVGDSVRFRYGRIVEITEARPARSAQGEYVVRWGEHWMDWNVYTKDGYADVPMIANSEDIVEIIPRVEPAPPVADAPTAPTTPTTQNIGTKHDLGKLRFGLVLRGLALPLRAIAAVLTFGAQKYAADSWQTVPNARERYMDANYRHMNARESGEVYDQESGLPHIAHEVVNLMFVMYFDIKSGAISNYTNFNKIMEKLNG